MEGIFRKCLVRTTILCTMLVISFWLIILINFSAVPSFYDADMYCDYQYAIEVWKDKSIFPEGWVFGNQLNVVSTPVLAALIYGLSGNINFSMGLASTIMTVLVLACFDWMVKPVLNTAESRLLAIALFLTITLYGGSAVDGRDGWTLFFTMCSYYAGYSITAFIAFGCYLRSLSGNFRKQTVVLFIIGCIFSFGTGIQSIRQTAIMVCPILAVEFLRLIVSHKTWKNNTKPLWIAAGIALSNFLGLVYIRIRGVNQNQIFGTIGLTLLEDMKNAARESILNLQILLDSDFSESNADLLIYRILCIGSLLLMLRNWKQKKDTAPVVLGLLISASVLCIVATDIFTTIICRPRYYFMLFPLVCYLAAYGYEHVPRQMKWGLIAMTVVFFCTAAVHELPEVCHDVKNRKEEDSYAISEYLLDNGYTTIYAHWEHGNRVAIASNGKLRVGFWYTQERTFEPITYLCNLDVFHEDPQRCVYFFGGQERADIGIQKAEAVGVALEYLAYYPDSNTYIYRAPDNLMQMID